RNVTGVQTCALPISCLFVGPFNGMNVGVLAFEISQSNDSSFPPGSFEQVAGLDGGSPINGMSPDFLGVAGPFGPPSPQPPCGELDRKSTRLNSSHVS